MASVRRISPEAAVVAALVVAAISLFVGLGASSLFVDEALSWQDARVPAGEINDQVRLTEVHPTTYFLGLHGWIEVFGDEEWVMRLPSAVAAIALVGAVAWLADRAAGRPAAAVAASLTAVSPLVLQYGQQVRNYAFAMLAVTIAVACVLELARAQPERRRRWFVATLVACVAAFWIHYMSALVVFVLMGWLATRSEWLTRKERGVGLGIAAFLCLSLFDQLRVQLDRHPDGGLEGFAGVTRLNLAKSFGAPFDGRQLQTDPAPLQLIAAVLCVWALVALLRDRSAPWAGSRGIAALAAITLGAVTLRTLGGVDVLASRYVTVAVPLMLVAVAVWIVRLPTRRALLVFATLVAIAIVGNIRSHLPSGHDSDARAAVAHIAEHSAPGEGILASSEVGLTALSYYMEREFPSGIPAFGVDDTRIRRQTRDFPGAWLVTRDDVGPQPTPQVARALGFRLGERRSFDGNTTLTVTHLRRGT